jgi:hypothetical protein
LTEQIILPYNFPIMMTLSVRSLAELALRDSCPRCFWILQKLSGKPPFQIHMPGIFREIDSHAKQLVRSSLDSGGLPAWFPELGEIVEYLPQEALRWQQFSCVDEGTEIQLRGEPDEVFRLADGSYHIVDYKTARITNTQDELFPMYQAQLNAYAFIAGRKGYQPISRLSLLYLEPQVGVGSDSEELSLSFAAVRREVAIMPELIPGLLRQALDILNSSGLPIGHKDCENCQQLDRLFSLLIDTTDTG